MTDPTIGRFDREKNFPTYPAIPYFCFVASGSITNKEKTAKFAPSGIAMAAPSKDA